MLRQFKTLAELNLAFAEPQAAIDHFTSIRWKNGQFCAHCGHDRIYSLKRKNIYRCAQCRTNFSITVGTIFENSKLPLRVWFGAIWLITNHKKGIASTTLAIDLGITQKSAWFLLHRLRHAVRTRSFNSNPGPLGRSGGPVEVDETYVGGKAINKHGRRMRGLNNKVPVIGAIQRGGDVIARVLLGETPREMQKFVNDVVSPKTKLLVTDAHSAYRQLGLNGFPTHQIINHQKGEYRRGNAHTNTIEGIWALLKRQIIGIHHQVSRKHLGKYVDEMTWRFNRREMTAEERVNALFSAAEGRLTYNALIGKA